MKKFQFPLERVRQYRKLQVEAERARLDACAARIREIDQAAESLAREKSDALESLHSGAEAPVYESYASYSDYAVRMRQRLASLRAQATAAWERQQAVVTVARQRLEMLDKFKDRALTEWKAEFAREQESLASELFLASAARQLRAKRYTGGQ